MDIQKLSFILEIFGFVLAGIDIFNKPLAAKVESFFDELYILGGSLMEGLKNIALFIAMFIGPFIVWGLTDYSLKDGDFPLAPFLYDLFGIPAVLIVMTILASAVAGLLKLLSRSFNILGGGHAVGGVGVILACFGLLIESTQTFESIGLYVWLSAILTIIVVALMGAYYDRKKANK